MRVLWKHIQDLCEWVWPQGLSCFILKCLLMWLHQVSVMACGLFVVVCVYFSLVVVLRLSSCGAWAQ